MERKALLKLLERVEPALWKGTPITEIFACFCFDGQQVHAWDDEVALIYPAKTSIKGGVRGRELLDFLKASRAAELKIEVEQTNVLSIQAGRSRMKTPLLPVKDFIFTEPVVKSKDATQIHVDQRFILNLSRAALVMGRKGAILWQCGVTMVQESGFTYFYAGGPQHVVRSKYKSASEDKTPWTMAILPPRFVELLIELMKVEQPKQLTFTSQWVSAVFESGLRLFGRTIDHAPQPKSYEELLAMYDSSKGLVPVPKGFDRCLERVALPIAHIHKEPHTKVKITDGVMHLETLSDVLDVKDRVKIAGHKDTKLAFHPEAVAKLLPQAEQIELTPKCVRLVSPGFTALVTTIEFVDESEAPKAKANTEDDEE